MAIFLAALSALVYGTADFTGGFAARRNDGLVVTVLSQCCGLVALAVGVPVGTIIYWMAAGQATTLPATATRSG